MKNSLWFPIMVSISFASSLPNPFATYKSTISFTSPFAQMSRRDLKTNLLEVIEFPTFSCTLFLNPFVLRLLTDVLAKRHAQRVGNQVCNALCGQKVRNSGTARLLTNTMITPLVRLAPFTLVTTANVVMMPSKPPKTIVFAYSPELGLSVRNQETTYCWCCSVGGIWCARADSSTSPEAKAARAKSARLPMLSESIIIRHATQLAIIHVTKRGIKKGENPQTKSTFGNTEEFTLASSAHSKRRVLNTQGPMHTFVFHSKLRFERADSNTQSLMNFTGPMYRTYRGPFVRLKMVVS